MRYNKVYKYENVLSGSKYEIRNDAPRCYDLYINLRGVGRFCYAGTYRTLEDAKSDILPYISGVCGLNNMNAQILFWTCIDRCWGYINSGDNHRADRLLASIDDLYYNGGVVDDGVTGDALSEVHQAIEIAYDNDPQSFISGVSGVGELEDLSDGKMNELLKYVYDHLKNEYITGRDISKAWDKMDRKRCPLEMADSEIYGIIESAIEDFVYDNDYDDLYIDPEEIFEEIDGELL